MQTVETGGSSWHQSNRGVSLFVAIYLILFLVVVTLSKFLHDRPEIGNKIPEAGMIILVGMAAGCIIQAFVIGANQDNLAGSVAESLLSFSPTVFFVVLLPPVIFNSGFHLHRDLFFRFISPICLFACVGTMICTVVVAGMLYGLTRFMSFQPTLLELLAFGSLISATDPVSTLAVFQSKRVDPHLFYLVFGESVINDAVGLVLFEAIAHLIEARAGVELELGEEVAQFVLDFVLGFFGSLLLGFLFGVAVAYYLKRVDMRSTPLLELCAFVPIMYAPFVLAEICRVSGIVTVLFTGITARRYAEPNLSEGTARNADTVFRLTAHITESFIFLELGLSVLELVGYGTLNIVFITFALIACLIGRAANIYPLTFLFNLTVKKSDTNEVLDTVELKSLEIDGLFVEPNKGEAIPLKFAHMLWFSGLRGSVSYFLVRMFPATENKAVFVVTTMFIVLLTTFVLGGGTASALEALDIPVGINEQEYLESLKKKKPRNCCRFLDQRLCQWVIRDYRKEDDPDATADGYEEHFEVTEEEHVAFVDKQSRSQTLYDFGG